MASRVPVEWCRVAACLQLVVAEAYPVVVESYPVVACPGAEEPCRVGAASLAWVPAAD